MVCLGNKLINTLKKGAKEEEEDDNDDDDDDNNNNNNNANTMHTSGIVFIYNNLLHVSAIQGSNTKDKTLKDDTIIEVTEAIQYIK
jgi:hypothetical protein